MAQRLGDLRQEPGHDSGEPRRAADAAALGRAPRAEARGAARSATRCDRRPGSRAHRAELGADRLRGGEGQGGQGAGAPLQRYIGSATKWRLSYEERDERRRCRDRGCRADRLGVGGELALAGVSCAVYERRAAEPTSPARSRSTPARWNCSMRAASPNGSSPAASACRACRPRRCVPRPRDPARPLPAAADRAPERHASCCSRNGPASCGVPIHRGARDRSAWSRTTTGATRSWSPDGPTAVTAAYVVGADGAHSAVRRLDRRGLRR